MVDQPAQIESLLVSELKHRLANSFQLLQAVIHIRLRSAEDPESRRHLSWLLDVVTALGMLQQRVGFDGPTDFNAYLIEATSYWRRVCDGRPIGIALEVASATVSEDHASTLALIAHELISNAIEHAFPGGRPGTIDLAFTERADGTRELVVRDNGVGMKSTAASESRQGLELVRGLAAHLGGHVIVDTGDGVVVRVVVPRDTGPRLN